MTFRFKLLNSILLLASLGGAVQAQQYFTGPYGPGGTWNLYEVVTTPATWDQARLTAKTTMEPLSGQNLAGHLVTLSSTNENNFVHAIAQGGDVWIGLTDHNVDGTEMDPQDFTGAAEAGSNPNGSWVWVDQATSFAFNMFGGGEPNNAGGGEDAVHIRGDGLWNDNGSSLAGETAPTFRYVIEYQTAAAQPIAGASTNPPTLLPTDLPGVEPGSGGTWNVRVIRDGPGVAGCTVAGALTYITEADAGNLPNVTDASSPVIAYFDTVSGICNGPAHLFTKTPFPGDGSGGADNFVMLAKTTILVSEAGRYTFGIHSDDGFAMRITGAQGVSETGVAGFDIADRSTWYYSVGICDVDSRAVFNFPVAGTYTIELIWYECGGNADIELYWAKGEFTADSQTTTWRLVGNPSGLPPVLPPDPLPGPSGNANGFGILFVQAASTIATVSNALEALTNETSTLTETNSPYVNWNDLDGGRGTVGLFGGDLELPGGAVGEDNNYVIVAKGCIRITSAGPYTFGVHSDDGFTLRIGGFSWQRESGGAFIDPADTRTLVFPNGTGDSDSRATMDMPVGVHAVEFMFFEGGGGSSAELYAAPGTFNVDSDTRTWALVGKPASDPPTETRYLGVTAPGWEVEWEPAFGPQLNTIADAEAALMTAQTSIVDRITYIDPESRGGGNGAWNPFPSNTAADDEDFAIRATATLEVPVDGEYEIGFQGDDGAYLQIEGQTWTAVRSDEANGAVINGDRLDFNRNTGNSRSIGTINLTAGTYTIRTLMWERGGGAYHWVFGGQTGGPFDVIKVGGAGVVPETSGLPLSTCGPPCLLRIARSGQNVVLTFDGTLEAASSVTGPWAAVPGAVSPHTVAVTGLQQYFRAACTPP